MNTKLFYKTGIFVFLLIQLVLFTNCSKKSDPALEEINNTELVSNEDILRIGKLHNEIASELLSGINWDAPNFNEEVIMRFNSSDIVVSSKKSDYTVEFIDEQCNTDKNIEILREKLSPEGFAIFEQGIKLCENVVSCETFINELEKVEKGDQMLALPDEEKSTILVSFSIWKNSAYYWLPTDMGGGGEGFAYLTSNKKSTNKWSIKSALVGDGVSGGVGMLGVVVAGACGPIGWTALAIVGGESAVSSVINGFN